MSSRKNRLEEIQDQLDILMDEVNKLRRSIADHESRRRSYPFPFDRSTAHDGTTPQKPDPDKPH